MPQAKFHPTHLVILQPIAGSLHLDHSVAPLCRPELHQVRISGPILHDISHDPFKPQPQMRRRQTPERALQQRLAQQAPCNERRLNTGLSAQPPPNEVLVAPRLQVRKALLESVPTTLVEIRALEIRRPILKVMEERAGYRRSAHGATRWSCRRQSRVFDSISTAPVALAGVQPRSLDSRPRPNRDPARFSIRAAALAI